MLGKTVTERDVLKAVYEIVQDTVNPIYFSVISKHEDKVINRQYSGNKVFDYERIFERIKDTPTLHEETIYLSELIGLLRVQATNLVVEIRDFINLLEKNELQLLIPVFYKSELLAVLVFGKRDVNNPLYIEEEIEFLKSVALITGLSLARAKLYVEVKDLNENLQEKVDEATKELQHKIDEMKRLHRREQDMLDIMGHELRTPMTIVKNGIKLMEMMIDRDVVEVDNEKFLKQIDFIRRATKREIVLIETMLDATKLDGRKLELNVKDVNFERVLEEGKLGIQHKAEEKGLQLVIEHDSDKDWIVKGDPVKLHQVVDNLLNNAVKYTQNGSVKVTLKDVGDKVECRVIDTGVGISEEDQKKLGTKFFRANNYVGGNEESQVVRPGGSGLGLYVTFGLVKAMGGSIKIKSELGEGSEFTFTVPKK